jgi:predicted DCC family thiol-disulfide oxidoreductase YuxK
VSDEKTKPDAEFIVFFDGVCGLCSKSVDWLMERDQNRKIVFAPLQGETAKKLLDEKDRIDLDTVIAWERGKVFRRSEAVFKAVQLLGPGWNLLVAVLHFIPVQIRDVVYRAVAANRYPIFGKSETCRLPTPEERSRFLD